MFEGGMRGFIDEVVNTVRCVKADMAHGISKKKRKYYDKYDDESQQESSQQEVD